MSLQVDIHKKLGAFTLDVALEASVEKPEVLGLLGASGCGKSYTLKCIAGIETPDKGRIVLDGETLFDSEKGINLPPQKRRVGYLFQNYALFPNMTVRQNILCGLRWEKISRPGKGSCSGCWRSSVWKGWRNTGLTSFREVRPSGWPWDAFWSTAHAC